MSGKRFGKTNVCGKICGKGKRRGSARECVKDRGKRAKGARGRLTKGKFPNKSFQTKLTKAILEKNSLRLLGRKADPHLKSPQRERERETRGERTDAGKRQGAEDGQEAVARGRVGRSMEVELETRATGVAVKANV